MKLFILISTCLFFSSCGTVRISVPNAEVQSSEVSPEGHNYFTFQNNPSHEFIATNDASDRPMTFDHIDNGRTEVLQTGIRRTFFSQLQTQLSLRDFLGLSAQVTWQWLKNESPYSSSIYAEGYYIEKTKTGDQKGAYGPGGFDWTGKISLLQLNVGTSVGYRFNEKFNLFVGGAATTNTIKTLVDQSPENGGPDPGGKYTSDVQGDGFSYAVGANINLTPSISLTPKLGWSKNRTIRDYYEDFNASLIFAF